MWYYIIKIISSSIILVAISEIGKRSSLMGSILASLPLISILAFIWMYIDSKDIGKIADLSTSIFWLVIPSLSFFIILPILLKKGLGFYSSLGISSLILILLYFSMIILFKKLGIKL